ncbi:gas vesicle protein G [Nonomuraea phyllanthi]|uniref:Gas vesicle protein G n=1 Tax=Nonomuraea phyllanthi TaxID=2219224 RepID=A0A5C4WWZ8_9ACTN|nr:gas vesicle protein GvpG [Nonomuraea phyllanthi]KAB8197733.1 gas vesicle protein G [Nonomuraea phyllanthi]QFY06290.1 gas vesicle protein G [Nonomuraea phyllanthi]
MGLLGLILGLPFAPIRGLVWLAELFQEQVDMETRNPASVRRHLEEIEAARAAGEITEEEESRAVERVLQLMATGRG